MVSRGGNRTVSAAALLIDIVRAFLRFESAVKDDVAEDAKALESLRQIDVGLATNVFGRAGIDDLEKHGVDCAAKNLQARRAFNAIPADAEATNDPAESAKAGKRTALTNNARISMESLGAVALKVQAGDKVELGEELRDIRLILDGIENDPFFGK